MIIDTIISSVTKYFTSLSVDSMQGYKKVALLEVDDKMKPTGFEVVIDATTTANLTISKQLMQHQSESKKVYMDGTKRNPMKMNISGHIDVAKLADIQRLTDDDVWLYLYMTKDIGGVYTPGENTSGEDNGYVGLGLEDDGYSDKLESEIADFEAEIEAYANGDDADENKSLTSDYTLYVIESLNIKEEGYKNTVSVTIDLTEVVLFEYDVAYKFGVKQNKGGKGRVQNGTRTEVPEPSLDTVSRRLF